MIIDNDRLTLPESSSIEVGLTVPVFQPPLAHLVLCSGGCGLLFTRLDIFPNYFNLKNHN